VAAAGNGGIRLRPHYLLCAAVVSKAECPEYHSRITHPMDLTTLAARAGDGTYDETARGVAGMWEGELRIRSWQRRRVQR